MIKLVYQLTYYIQCHPKFAQSTVFVYRSQSCWFHSMVIFFLLVFLCGHFCSLPPHFVSESCLCFAFDVNILRLFCNSCSFCEASLKTRAQALLSCRLKLTRACNCRWICPLKLKLCYFRAEIIVYIIYPLFCPLCTVHVNSRFLFCFFGLFLSVKSWHNTYRPSLIKAVKTSRTHFCPE